MLHVALARTPVVVEVDASLTDGVHLPFSVKIPDVVSSIAIKASAYALRFARRDAEDLYRLLEVAAADGVGAGSWPDGPAFATVAGKLSLLFDTPGSALSDASPSTERQVRIRALVRALVGRPG
jgi:hypothetical protein